MSFQSYLRNAFQDQQQHHLDILHQQQQQQELLQQQQELRQQQDLLVNSPIIEIINDVPNQEWIVYTIICIMIAVILFTILNECSENIIRCYHYTRFHINDKKARLKGCIRRKLLEKRLLDRTIKLRMSPYVASLPTDNNQPIKEFNLQSMRPIQTVVQEHIITIPSNYNIPK